MTRDRPFLLVGAFALLACAAWLALRLDVDQLWGTHIFGSFWASGDAVNRGVDPFGTHPLTPVKDFGTFVVPENNLNPPLLLPIFQAVALVDPFVGARVWTLVSALLFLGALAALARPGVDRLPMLWATANFMVLDTLSMGQIYSVMFVLATALWLFLDRGQSRGAGLALGLLVAIKPNFGLALVILALAGHRRLAGWGAATTLALSLVPLAAYGPEVYAAWLAAVRADLHWIYWADASLIGSFSRLGERPLGVLAAVALGVACVAAARSPRATLADAMYLGLAASILCSPLAWFHYLLVLVPALLGRRWGLVERIAALALVVPIYYVVPFLPDWFDTSWLRFYYVVVALALVAPRLGSLLLAPRPGSETTGVGGSDGHGWSGLHSSAIVRERRKVDAGGAALP